jgi:hypothetical protein
MSSEIDYPVSDDVPGSCAQVALAAFNEDMGINYFMGLNADELTAFRDRNDLSPAVMNAAWLYWQNNGGQPETGDPSLA